MKKSKWTILLVQLTIVLIFLFIWESGSRLGFVNSFIFSSPMKIIETLIKLFQTGELLEHVLVTFQEIVSAFALGIGIAFTISILMYISPFFARVIDPFLTVLNSLPKVALGPIIIIWVGANANAIIAMSLLINVIVSIITIYSGFAYTDPLKIKLFTSFGANKWQILYKLVIPANRHSIVSALKINISMTLIGVIMGEFLVSKRGIGYLIINGTQLFNLNLVLTGIVVLLIISFVLYEIIGLIEKRLLTE